MKKIKENKKKTILIVAIGALIVVFTILFSTGKVYTKNEGFVLFKNIAKIFNVGSDGSPVVSYITHHQNCGWTATPSYTESCSHINASGDPACSCTISLNSNNWVSDGSISGSVGESARLESIKIKLENGTDGGIKYRVHQQGTGWMSTWASNGAEAGTTGISKRVEAIEIKLTGNVASDYDVYYRTHIQTFGWLQWVKNGETSGSVGASKRMEALQIKLIPKSYTEQQVIARLNNFKTNNNTDFGYNDVITTDVLKVSE